jgi:hypothetical protein
MGRLHGRVGDVGKRSREGFGKFAKVWWFGEKNPRKVLNLPKVEGWLFGALHFCPCGREPSSRLYRGH